MTRTIKVKEGQTLLDIAMQETGDTSRALEIATANGVSLTTELVPGSVLSVPGPDVSKADIPVLLQQVYNVPASSDNEFGQRETESGSGIDFWIIEQTFIVQ
jgi:hypothetical protein